MDWMLWEGVAGGVVSADSGTGTLALFLMLPLTTSAKRLSPPQAGAGGGAATTVPVLVAVVGALTSTVEFEEQCVSLAIADDTNDLAITLCGAIGVLATLMDVSTAGRGGKEVA